MKDNHRQLSRQAKAPQEKEYDSNSVKLMVNEFVVLVNLKDEGVVDVVSSEYLNTEASGKKDEDKNWSKVVYVYTRSQNCPVVFFLLVISLGSKEKDCG